MKTLIDLKEIIPEMPIGYLFKEMIDAMFEYTKDSTSGKASQVKVIMTAIDLKFLHTHNSKNYEEQIESNIEAHEMIREIKGIKETILKKQG